eukprot:TRINITY_DN13901_c0_g1_i4.p1 TRINITY_DN13901_c0_g1~~TRINITY_DN13901_c0_g1_i4.p1  ORF type:complete len:169 (-),score=17.27 TRINITY_DN13901_c0_g1_i4:61-567(-)
MPRGVMSRWHDDKGFGFIKQDDGGEDVFCHVTGLLDGDGSVQTGDEVRYRIEYDDRKGKDRAVDVERVGGGGRSRSRSRRRSPPRRGGDGGGGGKGGGGKGERRPGDWDCSGCGAMVFASKDTCFKCGEPRDGGRGRDRGGRDRGDRGRGRDRSPSRDRRRRDRSYSR